VTSRHAAIRFRHLLLRPSVVGSRCVASQIMRPRARLAGAAVNAKRCLHARQETAWRITQAEIVRSSVWGSDCRKWATFRDSPRTRLPGGS
jgi:hypothetical protein